MSLFGNPSPPQDYEATLPAKRRLCPYELFSTQNPKVQPLEGYPNSGDVWEWPTEA